MSTRPKTERDPESGGSEPRADTAPPPDDASAAEAPRPREIGGQAGPEPTRYGDWEKKGRCTDF